jgi:hypothetical protein
MADLLHILKTRNMEEVILIFQTGESQGHRCKNRMDTYPKPTIIRKVMNLTATHP